VQEYIVWRVLDRAIDWFYLANGEYVDLGADADGITRSRQFPGLWLDRSALLKDDMPQVLAQLQTGLASAQHQAFGQSLVTKMRYLRACPSLKQAKSDFAPVATTRPELKFGLTEQSPLGDFQETRYLP
jgi:hypothetical protein